MLKKPEMIIGTIGALGLATAIFGEEFWVNATGGLIAILATLLLVQSKRKPDMANFGPVDYMGQPEN